MKVVIILLLISALAAYLAFETGSNFTRLRSLIGISLFVTIGFILSGKFHVHSIYNLYQSLQLTVSPRRINWRPVICGAIFQFLLGIFCIRWQVGRTIFKCFGDKAAEFLEYSKPGAAFVFGDFLVFEQQVFAFAVLPLAFFFSMFLSILYYLGTMQWILLKLGWILQSIIGTTVCESITAAANIFLGMTESPLMIKPYIKHLTESELHAVITSGFSTVSGGVMVAYIAFGAGTLIEYIF